MGLSGRPGWISAAERRAGVEEWTGGMQEAFTGGGIYGPERINALFGEMQGDVGQALGGIPQMAAPTVGGAQQYGMGAMGMAGRGAAIQAGHAAQGLEGLSPAARASAMARISQGAGAQMGQAGVQGMMQGGQWMQQAGMANLGAAQQRQQALMQERQGQRQMFGSAVERDWRTQQYIAQMGYNYRQQVYNQMLGQQSNTQRWMDTLGGALDLRDQIFGDPEEVIGAVAGGGGG